MKCNCDTKIPAGKALVPPAVDICAVFLKDLLNRFHTQSCTQYIMKKLEFYIQEFLTWLPKCSLILPNVALK